LRVLEVRGDQELDEVRSLRRAVFEGDLGLPYDALDDDELDVRSDHIICMLGALIIGAVRITLRSRSSFEDEDHLQLWQWMDEVAKHELALCSRLFVIEAYRRQRIPLVMFDHMYQKFIKEGVKIVLLDSCFALRRMYEELGFTAIGDGYHHEILDQPYQPMMLRVEHWPAIRQRFA
jgi:predicted GNAT family N-acyltransferase